MPPNTTASINITASTAMLPAALRGAIGLVQGFANNTKAILGQLHLAPKQSQKAPWVQHAVGQTVGNLATRGLDILVDQAKGVFEFNDKIVRLGIAAKLTAAQMDEIAKAARSTSTAVGVDARQVVGAYRAYIDLAGAQNGSITKMQVLARTAQASEAAGADLAGMMYQLTRSFKVADGEMENTMGGLINQAKDGAIEAKQMAAEFSGMAPMFARFGVVGREGAVEMGAMYQIARDGFDSASTAATGMIRLMGSIQRNASKFQKAGIQVFKPGSKSELRPMSEFLEQMAKSPLKNDIEKMIKAFGRSEGWRLFELLAEAPERLKRLEEEGRANGVVQKDLMTYAESTAGRMAIAFERAKNTIAEAFTPDRIEMFVSGLDAVINKLDPIMTMVGKIADGYGLIVDIGRSIRGAFDPNLYNNPFDDKSDAEKKIEDARSADEARSIRKNKGINKHEAESAITPAERAAAERHRLNRLGYEGTTHALAELQGDSEKPTDAAVRRAIEAAKMRPGQAGGLGQSIAGGRFLEHAPKAQVERMQAQIIAESLRPTLAALGKTITDAVHAARTPSAADQARAMYERNHANDVKVMLDGNPIAKSAKNATDGRRGTNAR